MMTPRHFLVFLYWENLNRLWFSPQISNSLTVDYVLYFDLVSLSSPNIEIRELNCVLFRQFKRLFESLERWRHVKFMVPRTLMRKQYPSRLLEHEKGFARWLLLLSYTLLEFLGFALSYFWNIKVSPLKHTGQALKSLNLILGFDISFWVCGTIILYAIDDLELRTCYLNIAVGVDVSLRY